jgi:hypothetical protein
LTDELPPAGLDVAATGLHAAAARLDAATACLDATAAGRSTAQDQREQRRRSPDQRD